MLKLEKLFTLKLINVLLRCSQPKPFSGVVATAPTGIAKRICLASSASELRLAGSKLVCVGSACCRSIFALKLRPLAFLVARSKTDMCVPDLNSGASLTAAPKERRFPDTSPVVTFPFSAQLEPGEGVLEITISCFRCSARRTCASLASGCSENFLPLN